MMEQSDITTVAMTQGKDSHMQTLKFTIDVKFDFAPIKFTGLSGLMIALDKGFLVFIFLLLL